MKEPLIPVDEGKRLEALKKLKLLDTVPEERFDRYTRLAASLFDVPIALVSLVDRHRQWFKSSTGLEVRETPRSVSVCGHVILQDEIFIVEDLSTDERFVDNPLITHDPNLRFYAGVPLKPMNKHALGTFCILDFEPRTFTEQNKKDLIDLATMVSDEMILYLDELTEVSNRRGFNVIAQTVLSAVQRSENTVSLVLLDLDNFKYINDHFGHLEGDNALKIFARCMSEVFRESDVVSRFGGDEFCVLLSNTSQENAEKCLVRLRELLDEENAKQENVFHLAFSAGIVESNLKEISSIDHLIIQADRILYAEKNGKKDSAVSV